MNSLRLARIFLLCDTNAQSRSAGCRIAGFPACARAKSQQARSEPATHPPSLVPVLAGNVSPLDKSRWLDRD
jgi:hypothetical protein